VNGGISLPEIFVLHSTACATLRGEPGAAPDNFCDVYTAQQCPMKLWHRD